ncbi:RNA-directed DNA polymerase, eukaryota [Tanacetum coccineum]
MLLNVKLWDFIASFYQSVEWGNVWVMGDSTKLDVNEVDGGLLFLLRACSLFIYFLMRVLNEVQLEGYSFTWAHPLASKMSKLDRFLVTDGFLSLFPHISAVCLDRHLSDHRPILLREMLVDFGAMPFRLYHSWLSIPGFDQMITRIGIRDVKNKLSDIDKLLDQGGVTDDVLLSRMEAMKQLQELNSSVNCDFVQKAKVRWAIEGDENSKFFHGIINRKRANLSVKGIMIEGEWVDDPIRVKDEFRNHFADRFNDPGSDGGWIQGSLNSGKASVLVNGSPTLEFQFHRGLKQGDPLAPFCAFLLWSLFIFLSNRAVESGHYSRIGDSWAIVSEAVLGGLGCSVTKIVLNKMENLLGSTLVNLGRDGSQAPKQKLPNGSLKNLSIGPKKFFNLVENLRRIFFQRYFRRRSKDYVGLFPRLFALETVKDISVACKLQSPLVSSFHRNVRGGIEEQQLEHLVALSILLFCPTSNDRWADVPTRWVKNILIKVNIFAWKLALDRLPTRANLVQSNVVYLIR